MTTRDELPGELGEVPFVWVPAGGAGELVEAWEQAGAWAAWMQNLLLRKGLRPGAVTLVPGVHPSGLPQVTVRVAPAGRAVWDSVLTQAAGPAAPGGQEAA